MESAIEKIAAVNGMLANLFRRHIKTMCIMESFLLYRNDPRHLSERGTHRFNGDEAEEMVKKITDARTFIFHGHPIEASKCVLIGEPGPEFIELDLPFDICLFEMSGFRPIFLTKEHQRSEYLVYGIVVTELSPRDYVIYLAGVTSQGGSDLHMGFSRYTYNSNDTSGANLIVAVKALIDSMDSESVATDKINERFKLKTRNGQELKKIKHVVHVFPKKTGTERGIYGGPLNWTHRWEVCGHWRKITGVGKNRSGEYCISGFTWVTPHERGDGPLIKKTRIVHGELNGNAHVTEL